MFYIHIGDSLYNFNPQKTKRITLEKTDDGAVLTIILIGKYFEDIRITFQNYEEAKKGFNEIASLVRMTSMNVIDIPTEHDYTVEFISKIKHNTTENTKQPTSSLNEVAAETAIKIDTNDN